MANFCPLPYLGGVIARLKMTGETPEVRSDKRKPIEKREKREKKRERREKNREREKKK